MRDALESKMTAASLALHAEIRAEQIINVTHLYQPGSAQLERLYAQVELANKWKSPHELIFNV
jgi:hypothetical protein